jgi:hypothetical protein
VTVAKRTNYKHNKYLKEQEKQKKKEAKNERKLKKEQSDLEPNEISTEQE